MHSVFIWLATECLAYNEIIFITFPSENRILKWDNADLKPEIYVYYSLFTNSINV